LVFLSPSDNTGVVFHIKPRPLPYASFPTLLTNQPVSRCYIFCVNGYKLPGSGVPEGDPGRDYFAYFFVFLDIIIISRLYKLTPTDLAQVTPQLRVSLSDLR